MLKEIIPVCCPFCKSGKIYQEGTMFYENFKVYHCNECKRDFGAFEQYE